MWTTGIYLIMYATEAPRIIVFRFGAVFGCRQCVMTNGNILVPISHFDQKVGHPDIVSSFSVSPEIPGIALDKANLFQNFSSSLLFKALSSDVSPLTASLNRHYRRHIREWCGRWRCSSVTVTIILSFWPGKLPVYTGHTQARKPGSAGC